MNTTDPRETYLNRLRGWRNRSEADLTLGFLRKQFKTQIEQPYKQLSSIARLWDQLVPQDLAAHTRLDSLHRGVLQVSVDSSPRLYELDRLLRGGLRNELITQHKGPALRQIRLRLAAVGV